MSKMKVLKNYGREITVVSFLMALLLILNSSSFILNLSNFLFIVGLGFSLLFVWFLATYWLYANKKVKRYGEVLLRVRLEEKFFKFFILPLLFYLSVAFTVFFSKSETLNILIILSFAVILFILLIHVRSSYEKLHYISSLTKIVYDAVLIMLFFLLLFSASSYGIVGVQGVFFAAGLSILLLLYKLVLSNQLSLQGYVIMITSTILIVVVGNSIPVFNPLVFSAVLTVAFYLVVAMWSIRLEGYTHWADFFSPIIYAIMILILIFSF